MKEHSAIAVANFFIDRALAESSRVTNLSLQKLVFFSHATALKFYGVPLVSDPCTAWPYGPVFVPLYHALKEYDDQPVLAPIEVAVLDRGEAKKVTPRVEDGPTSEFLSAAWKALSRFSASKLVAAAHQEGGAWYETVSRFVRNPSDIRQVIRYLPRNVTIFNHVIGRCGR